MASETEVSVSAMVPSDVADAVGEFSRAELQDDDATNRVERGDAAVDSHEPDTPNNPTKGDRLTVDSSTVDGRHALDADASSADDSPPFESFSTAEKLHTPAPVPPTDAPPDSVEEERPSDFGEVRKKWEEAARSHTPSGISPEDFERRSPPLRVSPPGVLPPGVDADVAPLDVAAATGATSGGGGGKEEEDLSPLASESLSSAFDSASGEEGEMSPEEKNDGEGIEHLAQSVADTLDRAVAEIVGTDDDSHAPDPTRRGGDGVNAEPKINIEPSLLRAQSVRGTDRPGSLVPVEPHSADRRSPKRDPREALQNLQVLSTPNVLHSTVRESLAEDMVSLREYFDVMKDYWEGVAQEKQAHETRQLDEAAAAAASTTPCADNNNRIMFFDPGVRPDADSIVVREDTDDRPCAAEPELDEEIDVEEDGSHVGPPSHPTESEQQQQHGGLGTVGLDKKEGGGRHDFSSDPSVDPDSTCASTLSEKSGHSGSVPDSVALADDLPANASPLPDATAVLASGSILARSSLRTIVLKKWQKSFWVRYGAASVYVFRSKEDFEDWLKNPYHTQRQRDYLVKLKLLFLDELSRRTNVRGFKMTDVKAKIYEKKGPEMHQFKLERWTDLGVSIVAAFASPVLEEVEALRKIIQACMDKCPDHGLRPIDDLLVK